MKKLKQLSSYLDPKRLIRFKDMNIIISICIFVIASFILGGPVGRNKIAAEDRILENYNYQVLSEIPNTSDARNIINKIITKECKVNDRKVLECSSFNGEFYNVLSFETEYGIKKNIHFVIDIFDISTVYIGKVDPNYEPRERFILDEIGYAENTEDYLIRFASDSLYFQAHPFGINSLGKKHGNITLKTEVNQVYYQSVLPDFAIDSENLTPEDFGSYLLDQLIIGNQNKIKLKAYTLTFLIGVLFTLITIIYFGFSLEKMDLIRNLMNFIILQRLQVFRIRLYSLFFYGFFLIVIFFTLITILYFGSSLEKMDLLRNLMNIIILQRLQVFRFRLYSLFSYGFSRI